MSRITKVAISTMILVVSTVSSKTRRPQTDQRRRHLRGLVTAAISMIAHTVVDNKNAAIAAIPILSAEVAILSKNGLAAAVLIGNSAIITAMTAVDKAAANSDNMWVLRRNCAVFASRDTAPKPYRPSVSSFLINMVRTSRFGFEPLWRRT